MAEASKSVAEKKATNVVAFDFASLKQDVGKGNENVGKEDLALPFLKILSGVDPMLDKLEDARKGDIYNSVTEASYSGKNGIVIVPVAYQREFLRWAPRGQGSGAPTVYKTKQECPKTTRNEDDNKDYVDDGSGDYIEETHQHFVLMLGEDGTAETALIPMKSTQLKKSRKFNSMIMAQCQKDGFARFAYKFRLKTLAEKNDKGSWHGWEMQLEGPLLSEETMSKNPAQFQKDLDTYEQAKTFSESVQEGSVEVKHQQTEGASNDQIPF